MDKYILLAFIFISQILFSQEIKSDYADIKATELSSDDLKKAVEGYKKLVISKTYLELNTVMLKLVEGNAVPEMDIIISEESYLKWITENISKTTFDNIEEPIALRKSYLNLEIKLKDENSEIYNLIDRANLEQKKIILKPNKYNANK